MVGPSEVELGLNREQLDGVLARGSQGAEGDVVEGRGGDLRNIEGDDVGPLVSDIFLDVEVLVVDGDSVELALEVQVVNMLGSHEHAAHVELEGGALGWDFGF